MSEKFEDIVEITPERLAEAIASLTLERLARLDALTDDDIAAQIAGNPDAVPELGDAWFVRERSVTPIKAAE